MSSIRMVISSDLAEVCLASLALHRLCLHFGMGESQASLVELCVAEAAANSIQHAYHGRSGHQVTLQLSASARQVLIEIADTGTPMPSECCQRLIEGVSFLESDPFDLDALADHGRGLQIIHDVMDHVAYLRCGETNCLRMIKLIE